MHNGEDPEPQVEEVLGRIGRELAYPKKERKPKKIKEIIKDFSKKEAKQLEKRLAAAKEKEEADFLGAFMELVKQVKLEREMEEELILILMGEK